MKKKHSCPSSYWFKREIRLILQRGIGGRKIQALVAYRVPIFFFLNKEVRTSYVLAAGFLNPLVLLVSREDVLDVLVDALSAACLKWQQNIIRQKMNVCLSPLLWNVPRWLIKKARAIWLATISWDETNLLIFFLPQGSRTKFGNAADNWKTDWGVTEQICVTATRM